MPQFPYKADEIVEGYIAFGLLPTAIAYFDAPGRRASLLGVAGLLSARREGFAVVTPDHGSELAAYQGYALTQGLSVSYTHGLETGFEDGIGGNGWLGRNWQLASNPAEMKDGYATGLEMGIAVYCAWRKGRLRAPHTLDYEFYPTGWRRAGETPGGGTAGYAMDGPAEDRPPPAR